MQNHSYDQLRGGFTIVEFLVVVSIIGILVGMLLPALHAVRATARRTACLNNHRQIALAIQGYESSFRKYPGPTFDDYPNRDSYSRDIGMFMQIVPFLDDINRWHEFNADTTTFDPVNQEAVTSTPAMLLCPEGDGAESLTGVAPFYGAEGIPDLTASTGDYRGNKGFFEPSVSFARKQGAIPTYVENAQSSAYIRKYNGRQVTDGLSNTVLCWDSIGSRWYFYVDSQLHYATWEESLLTSFLRWAPYYQEGPILPYMTLGTKGYFQSWAGFGTGTVWAFNRNNSRYPGSYFDDPVNFHWVVNASNQTGSPFSFHPGVCPMSFADGHAAVVNEEIDVLTFFALLSARGGEVNDADY